MNKWFMLAKHMQLKRLLPLNIGNVVMILINHLQMNQIMAYDNW